MRKIAVDFYVFLWWREASSIFNRRWTDLGLLKSAEPEIHILLHVLPVHYTLSSPLDGNFLQVLDPPFHNCLCILTPNLQKTLSTNCWQTLNNFSVYLYMEWYVTQQKTKWCFDWFILILVLVNKSFRKKAQIKLISPFYSWNCLK